MMKDNRTTHVSSQTESIMTSTWPWMLHMVISAWLHTISSPPAISLTDSVEKCAMPTDVLILITAEAQHKGGVVIVYTVVYGSADTVCFLPCADSEACR